MAGVFHTTRVLRRKKYVAPLVLLTGCCWKKIPLSDFDKIDKGQAKYQLGNRLFFALPITDVLASITALVLGILGTTGVIDMPAAAAYALIGMSGAITLLWIAMSATLRFCKQIVLNYGNLVT